MASDPDAWAELQAVKMKRDNWRRRVEERKKFQDILSSSSEPVSATLPQATSLALTGVETPEESSCEDYLLRCLSDVALILPIDSKQLQHFATKELGRETSQEQIQNLLQKFAVQQLINIQDKATDGGLLLEITSSEHAKLLAMINTTNSSEVTQLDSRKRKATDTIETDDDIQALMKPDDVQSLLSLSSTKEKENKRMGEEILELLSRPTTKEKTLAAQFKSQGGTNVQEFCRHGTKSECRRVTPVGRPCSKLHFRKIIQAHTDETLGDCSFLNTCFHMESCKYVHYEVDSEKPSSSRINSSIFASKTPNKEAVDSSEGEQLLPDASTAVKLHPAQWINCDLRFFDMTMLGKFSVIMADPPWDIHMELPYGTLSDDEMRKLNIPALQDEGLIFLWVTGRAMELGRECLQLWGYERVDELIWVKTNQLQRIIRTGRTGHWLNHGKEHCLVGMKGNPAINRGLDADIIVAEVRATSHKPDEVYGIIERLSPGTRKIELFGRSHNVQRNWMTLGNQLDGTFLVEEDLKIRFHARYPDGVPGAKPSK